jgi:methionine sulfoxide reductase heme-binding subunit
MWYASRATGVVSLLLLTAVALLGLLISRQGRLPGLPRFAVTGLHRNLSLLSVAFIALHVLTAVADGYVNIPLTASVIPFTSPYEGFWLGLGAVSFDIFLALIITSLLRRHLSRRVWYAVHLLAYASWPVAFAHSIGASTDMQSGWLLAVAIGCAVALGAGIVWRVSTASGDLPPAERVQALMSELHVRRPRTGAR